MLDTKTQQVIAGTDLSATGFVERNVFQDFSLAYTQGANPIQFRVRWSAVTGSPSLTLSDVSVDGADAFSAANFGHECGRFSAHVEWSADRFADPAACVLARGAGIRLTDGDYVARVELRVADFALDGATLATLGVIDREENKLIASAAVKRGDFPNIAFRTFSVPFHAYAGDHYDVQTAWLAAPNAPRLTERGAYIDRATAQPAQ